MTFTLGQGLPYPLCSDVVTALIGCERVFVRPGNGGSYKHRYHEPRGQRRAAISRADVVGIIPPGAQLTS
jgi:hypothetical protein